MWVHNLPRLTMLWLILVSWISISTAQDNGDTSDAGSVVKPFVIGGTETKEGNVLFAAYLVGESHACTGSIISDQYILTAAHCTFGRLQLQKVLVGALDIAGNEGEVIDVETSIPHPLYESADFKYDYAVLKLKTPITTPLAKPITLLRNRNEETTGTVVTLAGWGKTSHEGSETPDKLLQVENSVLSFEDCKNNMFDKIYNNATDGVDKEAEPLLNLLDEDSNVCTLRINGGGTAQGDSGGPMFYNRNGVDVLMGVTSWGINGDNPRDYPEMYASVAGAYDFINKNSVGHTWAGEATTASDSGANHAVHRLYSLLGITLILMRGLM